MEFSEAITTKFRFSYSLGGVTAMPRGLHAKLCLAFLVSDTLLLLLLNYYVIIIET